MSMQTTVPSHLIPPTPGHQPLGPATAIANKKAANQPSLLAIFNLLPFRRFWLAATIRLWREGTSSRPQFKTTLAVFSLLARSMTYDRKNPLLKEAFL